MPTRDGGHGGHDGGSSSGHPGNNIHTHGLHISGSGNSDDVTRHTKAGECSFYQYSIPSDHMGGTHWYHPHVHYHTLDQVSGGAFGFIIVEDRGSDEIVDPSSAGPSAERQNVENFLRNPENELMLMAVRKGGAWQNLNHDGISNYTLVAGQWYRLRIITINPDAEPETLRFPFECTVRALAHDGVYRFTPPKAAASDYYLTGASRVDVAIKCDTVTTVPLELQLDFGWDTTYSCSGRNGYWGGECWSNPGPSVASISVVTGTPNNETPLLSETVQGQWKSWRPFYLRDVLTESTQNTFTVDISSRDINNLEYDENCPLKDGNSDFQANTVQEWTLKDIDRHPFHLHLYHQQIANTQCGPGHDVGEYYDTVADAGSSGGWNKKRSLIKESRWGGSGSSSSECKVKFHSSDIGGSSVLACASSFKHIPSLGIIWGPNYQTRVRKQSLSGR